jgi:hypothetical protein
MTNPVGTEFAVNLRTLRGAAAAAALLFALPASAFTVAISSGPRTIYLQVGVGSFTGSGNPPTLRGGGSPAINTTINTVTVSVTAAQVGTGTAQAMNSGTGATNSFWDNFVFCNAGQVYIGGFYRTPNNNSGAATAAVTASVPATLSNGSGGTISFSQISWTSSGNSDTGAQPFAAGTFSAGSAAQPIGTIARNQWAESCHTFSYANTAVVPAGTYTGTVTYTLTAQP